jgi:hypothetical protein
MKKKNIILNKLFFFLKIKINFFFKFFFFFLAFFRIMNTLDKIICLMNYNYKFKKKKKDFLQVNSLLMKDLFFNVLQKRILIIIKIRNQIIIT